MDSKANDEEDKPVVESFGRFIYMGRLWGNKHVWSTTDPPNYGAVIGLDVDGSVRERNKGEHDPAPTDEEVTEAQKMVKGTLSDG